MNTEAAIREAVKTGAWQRCWLEHHYSTRKHTHVIVERYGDVQIMHAPRGGYVVRGPAMSSWAKNLGDAVKKFRRRARGVSEFVQPDFPEWELSEREEACAWKQVPGDYIEVRVLQERIKRLEREAGVGHN